METEESIYNSTENNFTKTSKELPQLFINKINQPMNKQQISEYLRNTEKRTLSIKNHGSAKNHQNGNRLLNQIIAYGGDP